METAKFVLFRCGYAEKTLFFFQILGSSLMVVVQLAEPCCQKIRIVDDLGGQIHPFFVTTFTQDGTFTGNGAFPIYRSDEDSNNYCARRVSSTERPWLCNQETNAPPGSNSGIYFWGPPVDCPRFISTFGFSSAQPAENAIVCVTGKICCL